MLNSSHQDALQSRLDKTLGRKDEVYGSFNFQSTRAATQSFRFTDTTDSGNQININWSHRFSQRLFVYAGYHFSRLRTKSGPILRTARTSQGRPASRQRPGPGRLGSSRADFSSGITALSDERARSIATAPILFRSITIYRGRHNITIGGDFRKQEYNEFFQQIRAEPSRLPGPLQGRRAARTGGSDLADFLIGVPDTSSMAFGNAEKYLRQPVYDLYDYGRLAYSTGPHHQRGCAGNTARRSPNCTDAS